jgi:hypothetical protein
VSDEIVLVSNFLAWPGFAPSAYRLVAFVVRRGRPISRLDLGPIQPIDACVEQWRAATQANGDAPARAFQVHKLVWRPHEMYLAGSRTILISPDGLSRHHIRRSPPTP